MGQSLVEQSGDGRLRVHKAEAHSLRGTGRAQVVDSPTAIVFGSWGRGQQRITATSLLAKEDTSLLRLAQA